MFSGSIEWIAYDLITKITVNVKMNLLHWNIYEAMRSLFIILFLIIK